MATGIPQETQNDEPDVETVVYGLAEEVIRARRCFRCRSDLGNFLAARPAIFEYSPVFYATTLEGLTDAVVLGISRLLDKGGGFAYCLNLMRSQKKKGFPSRKKPGEIDGLADELQAVLAKLRTDAAPIKTRRDWKLAHLDQRNFTDPVRVLREVHLPYDQMYALLVRLYGICQRIIYELFDRSISWDVLTQGGAFSDTGRLLELGFDRREQLFKEQRFEEIHNDWARQGRALPPPDGVELDPEKWQATREAWRA